LHYAFAQQQYLFATGGWKPEERQPIKAGSKKKKTRRMAIANKTCVSGTN